MQPDAFAKQFPGVAAKIRHLMELQAQLERYVGSVNPGGTDDLGDADPNDPQPGETVQQYADRVGPILGGAEARRRWLAKGNQ